MHIFCVNLRAHKIINWAMEESNRTSVNIYFVLSKIRKTSLTNLIYLYALIFDISNYHTVMISNYQTYCLYMGYLYIISVQKEPP